MRTAKFRLSGKFGHFLRAEANVSGVTYPYPPRTALLGLLGAVFGLDKDEPQERWADAKVAIAGVPPKRFWHKTNVRKDGPPLLSRTVKAKDKGSDGSVPRNMRFDQEWLWHPSYTVWAGLPGGDHAELAGRLSERRWHYTPCLGLAFLFADLTDFAECEAAELPDGVHTVRTLARQDSGVIDLGAATGSGAAVVSLRMPRSATAGRVFGHAGYWHEHKGSPFPLRTADAFECSGEAVTFL